MCGIVGVIDHERPASAHASTVRRMVRALHHRGPDDHGQWQGRHACLGHTRLALLDRSRGAQPMLDPGRRWVLVYNGEVYNHEALRQQLRDRWEFRTRSDTEVVLAALVVWGEDALPRLDGMFALAWWDEQAQRGLLARDRLGVKPLAYRLRPRGLEFASEAKALVAIMDGRPRPDMDALQEVLAAPCFSGVRTPAFADLHYLQPGECMWIRPSGIERRIWAPLALTADRRDEGLPSELRAAVTNAVARTRRADVPVGVFFSGGLDSTLVASLLARDADESPRAYTIEFDGQDRYDYDRSRIVISDDTPFALRAAEQLGLEHHRIRVPTASIDDALPRIARIDDGIPVWEQQLAQHHLAAAAAPHDRAIMVGDAADETHYGYHFLLDEQATRSPLHLLRRFPSAPLHPDWGPDPQARLAEGYAELQAAAGHEGRTPRERVLATTWLVLRRWLPRLLHNGDIHTMAFSVEARVPFADRALVDLALAVDPERAWVDGQDKALLREAVRGLLPEEVRTRRKSALPKDQRTARLYQAMVSRCLDEDSAFLDAVCDRPALDALLDPRRSLDEGERAVLFRVAAVAHWQRAYDVAVP